MSHLKNISNQTILQSTLLSNMAYIEQQLLHESKILQETLVSEEKTKEFIQNNSYSNQNIEDYSNLYLKKLTEDKNYETIIQQRMNFYCLFKNELQLNQLDKKDIYPIAKNDCLLETKKQILRLFVDLLDIKNKNDVDYIENIQLLEPRTQLLKNTSQEKLLISTDTDKFSENFNYIEFSKSIEDKFRYFRHDGSPEIQAEFKNGYVNIGQVDQPKDMAFLVGYTEENGNNVLNISFRGTERKLKSALNYFLENYPNIETQYHYLEPILKEIIQEEIQNHKLKHSDKPLRVIFTGHSLGASLAEKALNHFQDSNEVKFNAVLISNPGSFHYMQKIVTALDKIENTWDLNHDIKNSKFTLFKQLGVKAITKPIKAAVLVSVGLSNYAMDSIAYGFKHIETHPIGEQLIKLSTLKTAQLLNDSMLKAFKVGKHVAFKTLGFLQVISPYEADPRSLTINHERDNIPLVGKALFQNKNPQEIKLNKLIDEVEKLINPWKKVFHLEYHKAEHYYSELKQIDESNSHILDKIQKIRNDSNNNIINKNNKLI